MADATKPVLNIADVPLMERGNGDRFAVKWGRMGPHIGSTKLGCALHVVPPGKRAFPLHRHHVIEELFYVVSGVGEYRWGDETFSVRAGDVIGAPAGARPHQLVNTGSEDLRYLGISTIGAVDICEYPDSGKVAAAAGIWNADFATATFTGIGRIQPADYWDGEA
ncbi:MAG: cupin domain-containing protein [Hyphomicrobiaceae bacterium]|nr:cupin domain-containing protein [Hyphomicrobiaceae bacterium]